MKKLKSSSAVKRPKTIHEFALNIILNSFFNKNGCLETNYYEDKDGYPSATFKGKHYKLNRFSLMYFRSIKLDGLFACHTCDNPKCINPNHLFAGSPRDNIRDSSNKKRLFNQKKTHCPKGHAYTAENAMPIKRDWGTVTRTCRTCSYERHRSWYEKNKDSFNEKRRVPIKIKTQCSKGHDWIPENWNIHRGVKRCQRCVELRKIKNSSINNHLTREFF